MPGHDGGWRLLRVVAGDSAPGLAGQGHSGRAHPTLNKEQGHHGSPSPGTGHLAGDWGWDKAGLGNEPTSVNRGLPWALLCSICSREQEGAQLESRSQVRAISKCMQMPQPY